MDQFNYGIDLIDAAKGLGQHDAALQREAGVYHVGAGLERQWGFAPVYVCVQIGAAIATMALEAYEAEALAWAAR